MPDHPESTPAPGQPGAGDPPPPAPRPRMSDELVKHLNAELSELRTRHEQLKVALRQERTNRKSGRDGQSARVAELERQVQDLTAERDEAMQAVEQLQQAADMGPDEKDQIIADLYGEIRQRDHRSAFDQAAAAA